LSTGIGLREKKYRACYIPYETVEYTFEMAKDLDIKITARLCYETEHFIRNAQ